MSVSEEIPVPPKSLAENVDYRLRLLEAAKNDVDMQKGLIDICSKDIVFWWNTFGFTFDPRKDPSAIPMVLYDFQEDAIKSIEEAMGVRDLCISKSRDMGASWMLLGVFLWRWLFREGQAFLLISRNEDYVDKAGNPKSLFWKIDFLMQNLPTWMYPNFTRHKLRLSNHDNGSVIDGESTTGDVARGDRRTAIGLDEFASFDLDSGYRALAATRDATLSRIFNSTPSGTSNAFYAVAHNTSIEQLRLHWPLHPEKAEGLYMDGEKKRSPWYDTQCDRCASPIEIAQELDIDFAGSSGSFFDHTRLDQIAKATIRSPNERGELEFDPAASSDSLLFNPSRDGKLRLWLPLSLSGDPVRGDYAFGIDISAGTGSSNSCISMGDRATGEKVGEFASPHLRPDQLARYAVALARWFKTDSGRSSTLCWEAQGPGRIFGDMVVELGHREIWYRKREGTLVKSPTQMMGWIPTRDTKQTLFGNYRKALFNGNFINRSREALDECREIVYSAQGGVEHSRSINSIDVSGARANHGDRATADALLSMAMGIRGVRNVAVTQTSLPGSLIWRRKQSESNARKASNRWL